MDRLLFEALETYFYFAFGMNSNYCHPRTKAQTNACCTAACIDVCLYCCLVNQSCLFPSTCISCRYSQSFDLCSIMCTLVLT